MKPVSLAGMALALTSGISAQLLSTSTAALVSYATSLSVAPFKNLTSTTSTASQSAASAAQSSSPPSHKHVDTIHNTTGVPSTKAVAEAKLTKFCGLGPASQEICTNLQTTVVECVDLQNDCTETVSRDLLATILDSNPCMAVPTNESLQHDICNRWYLKAKGCNEQYRRGPCGYHHVLYLLREFRDFLALPKGGVSVVQKNLFEKKRG